MATASKEDLKPKLTLSGLAIPPIHEDQINREWRQLFWQRFSPDGR